MQNGAIACLIGLALIFVLYRLAKSPLRRAVKLLLNTAFGFFALICLDLVSGHTGISLGVNLPNSVAVGLLGLPGFGMLLMMRWMFP